MMTRSELSDYFWGHVVNDVRYWLLPSAGPRFDAVGLTVGVVLTVLAGWWLTRRCARLFQGDSKCRQQQ